MPEKIFDPTIHQDLDHLEGFKFRHTALNEGLEVFKKASDRYRDASCPALAQLIGLAESTLKKLKQGQISDPRGSTYWLIWKGTGIDVRRLMGIPVEENPSRHAPATQALLDEKDKRIAELERGLVKREHMIIRRNKLLGVLVLLCVAIFIADLLIPGVGWIKFGLLK